MAARTIASRFLLKKDSTVPQLFRPLSGASTGSCHHNVVQRAPFTTTSSAAAAAPLISLMPVQKRRLPLPILPPPSSRYSKSYFSSLSSGNVFQRNWKKSPHSKLLRVCSERNTNSHFAAIEADMLRLNWKESMDALVEDWSQRLQFDHFIELERNVRTYVNKNLTDLKYYESDCAHEWNDDQPMTLSDHVRFHLFPYERIVNGTIQHAISGKVTLSSLRMKEMGGNEDKIAMAQLRERILVLENAGKLLDAMTSFNVDEEDEERREEEEGEDQWYKDEKEEEETKNITVGWTVRHTACSNCYRSLVSGWFLLNRRLSEANKEMVQKSNAKDILEAMPKLEIHPEHETQLWTQKWIEFCTANNGEDEGGYNGQQGILLKDKPLLMGVAKILSMAGDGKRRMQSAQLSQQLDMLFPEDE